ncbi:MAG: hypothetical protein HOG03_11490 [Desulfobacula sp.]|uniref:hypothetical protein n=1 Tax=Desulfobacula sp. TaxID=2593537 RepID=UPI001D23E897|nr:hypothetical protein [Desulfobacula sp.]MBT3484074.1 hypothetical protein [Desulfobacula sp.]MBT3805206.1 hypothetical protein [Desulfobacula sp.]MBT4024539.1 hypothetical protein [Desulfobacula sp.]MBT4199855.1 hypothetical protein [Desulfobacula sp.]
MPNINIPFRNYEDEVFLNLINVQRPGDIVHAFGEFMIVPTEDAAKRHQYSLTNNSTDTITWGNACQVGLNY